MTVADSDIEADLDVRRAPKSDPAGHPDPETTKFCLLQTSDIKDILDVPPRHRQDLGYVTVENVCTTMAEQSGVKPKQFAPFMTTKTCK